MLIKKLEDFAQKRKEIRGHEINIFKQINIYKRIESNYTRIQLNLKGGSINKLKSERY